MTIATVSIERRGALPVVHVRGEIDFPNADAVRTDVFGTMPIDGPGLILDLTQTTYLDSSSIRMLFEVAEHLQASHQRLLLVVTEEALIRRVIVLTKLDDVMTLVATVDEALTILRST